MLLVNPEMYRTSTTSIDKKLSDLDQEISSVLNSNLPDDMKAKYYQNALRSHKFYENPKVKVVDSDVEILKNVLPEQKVRAKELLNKLKPFLTWNDDGEIIANGQVIQYSNIAHLISDLLTPKRRQPTNVPEGWDYFEKSLKDADIPSHLILNEDRWRRLAQDHITKRKKKGKKTPQLQQVLQTPRTAIDRELSPFRMQEESQSRRFTNRRISKRKNKGQTPKRFVWLKN